jgi:hypothetical protein
VIMQWVDGFLCRIPNPSWSTAGVTATAVDSKDDARILHQKKTMEVLAEGATGEKP